MPPATLASVRKQLAQGKPDPVYLIVGDDDVEMARLASDISALVEDELRAFNLERMYASDKSVTAASIAEAASTLPMLGERRVVVVLRAEKILKPKRRGKAVEESEEPADDAEPPSDLDALEAYVKQPSAQTVLVLVASDVDRTRKIFKALQKHATIVVCQGLYVDRGNNKTDLAQTKITR